eukprot:134968_1
MATREPDLIPVHKDESKNTSISSKCDNLIHQNNINHSLNNNDNDTINKFELTEIEKETKIDKEDDEHIEDWQILKKSMIDGVKVKLVPYTADHVPTYNKWLSDPYIQTMTSSEPYSLEQEYEYQKEWNDDETKYIFIILDKTNNNRMAGDINIFIQN